MQKYGLQCMMYGKRKYNSYKGQVGYIADNIIDGDFSSSYFGEKLTTDISKFRYGDADINHRVYLSPVMDLYSDKIIAYGIDTHSTMEFTLKPLKQALSKLKGLRPIVHSNQGI